MPIYTKKGDKGETGLPGGRRLPKTEAIFEFLGSLDQTNSVLGLAISGMDPKKDKQLAHDLNQIQQSFLAIGACIASEKPSEQAILGELPRYTEQMESTIDRWDRAMPELKNFILPGGTQPASFLHLARTLIRQTERAFHRLDIVGLEPIAIYLNRLSDFFFQAARYHNFSSGFTDTIWAPKK